MSTFGQEKKLLVNINFDPNVDQNKFEDKSLASALLQRILNKYLGISVNVEKKRGKREGDARKESRKLEVAEVDELMELLMYSEATYSRSDALTEKIKEWARDNKKMCRWYHLYEPDLQEMSIEDAWEKIHGTKYEFIEEEAEECVKPKVKARVDKNLEMKVQERERKSMHWMVINIL